MVSAFAFGPAARAMLVRLRVDDAGIAQLAQAVELDLRLQRVARMRGPSPATMLRRWASAAKRAEQSSRRGGRLLDPGDRGGVG